MRLPEVHRARRMKLHKIPEAMAGRYYRLHTFNAIVSLTLVFFGSSYAWRLAFLIVFVIQIGALWLIRRDMTESSEK